MPEAPTQSLAHTLLWGFARVFSVVALIVAWEGLARSGQFTPFVLPSLSSVIERIWTDAISGDLAINDYFYTRGQVGTSFRLPDAYELFVVDP